MIRDVYHVHVGYCFEVVGEVGSGEELTRVIKSVRPDLLLLDLSMPRMSGLEALEELAGGDQLRTILLAGAISRSDLLKALHLGVRGVLLKDASTETLFHAIATVMAGQYWLGQGLVTHLLEIVRPLLQAPAMSVGSPAGKLTRRERQVLDLIVAGYSNKDIAREFAVSEQTVKHHLTRMFDKVGASNRLELAMVATRPGFDQSTA